MSKFESTFKAAIAENERRILIESLRGSPELTLGEIHKLSKGGLGRLFSEITIADLLGSGGVARPAAPPASKRGPVAKAGAPVGRKVKTASKVHAAKAEAAPPEAAPPEKSAKARRGKAKGVNTRTAEGRAAYDEALYLAVKDAGGPAGAGALIAVAGGTSLQARAGLARLIEAGRITWSGKARGTKYSVA